MLSTTYKSLTERVFARVLGSSKFGYLLITPAVLLLLVRIAIPQSSQTALNQTQGVTQKDLTVITEATRALIGGETHSYRIDLNTGQFFYALVEQEGIDVVIDIFDPTGKHVANADSPNDNWDTEPILLLAKMTGSYRIDISSTNKKVPAGRYAIKLVTLRQATADDKAHVDAEEAFDEGRKLRAQGTAASRRSAIEKYEQAVLLFKTAGDTYRQALAILSIGFAYAQLNEFRTALRYFDETLSLAQQLNQLRLQAATQTFLGGANDFLGNFNQALNHYAQAQALASQSGNIAAAANALNNIGKIYNDSSDWQKALDFYSQALPLLKQTGNQRNQAQTLNNIGVAYKMLGEFGLALDNLQESLSLRRSTADKNGESLTLLNIGKVFAAAGDYIQAQSYYSQAEAIERETGNKAQEAETLDAAGYAYTISGDPAKAVGNHEQALAIHRATGNAPREAVSLTHLGYALNLLGQPVKARERLDQAVQIFRSIGDLNYLAIALQGIASAELQRGNFNDARKSIEESLTLIETVRARAGSQQLRYSYLASMRKPYDFYVDLLMQQNAKEPGKGHDAEALQAYERGRARSLLEMLNERHVDIRQGVPAALVERERNATQSLNAKAQRLIQLTAQKGNQQEIETLNKEVSGLEQEYQQVQISIRKASPAYAELTQPRTLDLREIQQQLDANTLLLEYTLGDEQSYLWAVTKDSLTSNELPKRETIETFSRQVYQSLTARSIVSTIETSAQRQARIEQADSNFENSAAALSKMILAPVVGELGKKRLVIVADGALQYIPFAALKDPQSSGATPLILQHEVITLPSASSFAVQRQLLAGRKQAPKAVAVIADPVFSAKDTRVRNTARTTGTTEDQIYTKASNQSRIIEHLSETGELAIRRLPFTRQEAEQILAVSPGASNLSAVGFRANRSLATSEELSKYRYVHFATHGYLDSARADFSALVLSMVDEQGKPQDGFLRVYDIYNLNLPAELVVLSACETGLGKDVKGEGLVGLTRGFMYAGARRVIVSLWNVNDRATASLMERVYAGMLKAHKTPAAALRAAQVEMLRQKQWQSPYYWAAFVLQGEWN